MLKKYWLHGNRTLLWTGFIHLGLALLFVIFSMFDQRLVLGIPLWIKPIKFALSIGIYALTLAYLVPYVTSAKARSWIATGTTVSMFVEMGLISMQAARGTISHYNMENALGIIIYAIMGVFIAFASALLVVLGIRLLRDQPTVWTTSFRQAVQMAIWITVVGTIIGGYMSALTGHTVGGADGGVGLPFLNWSTQFGDWRVSHFVGLHGLQVFLIVGWLLRNHPRAIAWQWVACVLYSVLLLATIVLTWLGQPVVR
jgi:hypothetical protein